jgi:cytochrome c peroxidase
MLHGVLRPGLILAASLLLLATACVWRHDGGPGPAWEADNPVKPLPSPPLGVDSRFESLPVPPTPERVRLGRWLFFDTRLSADGTIACASCHRPEHAFSEPVPVSTGVGGQKGTRKSPALVNLAWTMSPHFFWDGRADTLEAQALGPFLNPVEMGLTEERLVEIVEGIPGYRPYFAEAFGDPAITTGRIAHALADYQRTQMAGNSAWDRWRKRRDAGAVSDQVKRGHELFFGKAACNQCHLGESFTDNQFHNVGVGWVEETKSFADEGRAGVTGRPADRGAFKTPTLRDVSRHPPFLHDGSAATLREVVELYNRGGTKNPHLSPKMFPLGLTDEEMDALVAFMEALDSPLPFDTPPAAFPR